MSLGKTQNMSYLYRNWRELLTDGDSPVSNCRVGGPLAVAAPLIIDNLKANNPNLYAFKPYPGEVRTSATS